jgi:hypothetical protein
MSFNASGCVFKCVCQMWNVCVLLMMLREALEGINVLAAYVCKCLVHK